MSIEGVHLLEHLQTPAMMVSRGQVRFANSAAKALLGAHVVGQDVRIAIRDPRAVAAILSENGGSARVKGLSWARTVWGHAFRNIAVQVLTVVALSYAFLLEGAVLTETVFAWPGFGRYLTNALLAGDMNAVVGCTLLVGVIFVTLNLLCDLLYRVFDPRTR